LSSRLRWPRPWAILAFARRDAKTSTSYRAALVFDLVLSAITLIIYYYISKLFARPAQASLSGAPTFFSFVAVGVSVAVIVSAGSVGLAASLRQEQFTGTLEALAVKPVTTTEMAFGLAIYPFLFSMVRCAIYIAIAAGLLGADFSNIDPLGFVLGILLTGLALVSVGITMGALVFVVKRGEAVSGILVSFLVLLGGAYFPVTIFPAAIEAVARVVPTRFAFDGVRAAVFRGEGWVEPLLKLLAFGVVSLPIAVFLFDRAIRFAKRRGSLAQY
jgi:ABC-2 type transport system permease protein